MRTFLVVLTILMLLSGELPAGSGSTTLLLQVKPEVALSQPDPSAIQVMIRLPHGSHASVWSAEVCDLPSSNAFRIGSSGIYRVPLSQLSVQGASRVCLTSSDGSLSAQLRLLAPTP